MNYWLMKSEPDVYGFEHLLAEPNQTGMWDGIRNYQARNFMRDSMKLGDKVLFYHSNTKPPGVVGVAEIVTEAYPDPTQFDPNEKYFDAKANPENPRWVVVDIKAIRKLNSFVSLEMIKAEPELASMRLVQKGNRLSIMPLEKNEFEFILELGK